MWVPPHQSKVRKKVLKTAYIHVSLQKSDALEHLDTLVKWIWNFFLLAKVKFLFLFILNTDNRMHIEQTCNNGWKQLIVEHRVGDRSCFTKKKIKDIPDLIGPRLDNILILSTYNYELIIINLWL